MFFFIQKSDDGLFHPEQVPSYSDLFQKEKEIMIEVDFDNNGFGAKVNPVAKPPIRQRITKKPTSVMSEAKTTGGLPMKPTMRPIPAGKNPKQARGDSMLTPSKEKYVLQEEAAAATRDKIAAKKETAAEEKQKARMPQVKTAAAERETALAERKNFGAEKETVAAQKTEISEAIERAIFEEASVKQEAAPPKREAVYSKPAEAMTEKDTKEVHTFPAEHQGSSPTLRHPDVKGLKPKAMVRELPPLPPSSYNQPPAYSPPLAPSYQQPYPPSSFSEPLASSFNQPYPPPYSPLLPKSYSPTLPPSYPSATSSPYYHPSALDGVFVEPSSLSSAPYLYINQAAQPNVPKIPKSAPYPFVKPAPPPTASAYKSKLEDYTVHLDHLSQKRHIPPSPENDINRMDAVAAAAAATAEKLTSDNADHHRQDDVVPRPQGTPRPRSAEDSEGEADTNSFSRYRI